MAKYVPGVRAVILLATVAHKTLQQYDSPHLGRLVQPRHYSSIEATGDSGMTWAADNDAYNGGFDPDAFIPMLDRLEGVPGCKFVACPDVVGDWRRTASAFELWAPAIVRRGLPLALVAQDGLEARNVPWFRIDALFIGGTTEWKMGEGARLLVEVAQAAGKWVHMGRVNSWRRMVYARSIGCDSVDGSKFAQWRDTYLPQMLRWLENSGTQLRLEPA